MKDEIGKYYDIEPWLSLENFVELLFASLANKKYCSQKNITYLPFDYLQIIEMIMYNDDCGWKIKFSRLMDIRKYYDKQSEWEVAFGEEINKYLAGKNVTYDFQYSNFLLEISQEEIEKTFKKYTKDTLDIMEHFTNLLSNPSYERRSLLQLKESKRWQQEKMQEMWDFEHIILLERTIKKEKE